MIQRPMRCLLPGCSEKLRFLRRIRGYWYCSEQHYKRDKKRREADLDFTQGISNPMRCWSCNRRIPLHRRVFAMEYCSRYCYREYGSKGGPRAYPEPLIEISQGDRRIKLPRREFFVGALAFVIFELTRAFNNRSSALAFGDWPVLQGASHQVRFESWTADELKLWIANSSAEPAYRLENGALQILGTILLATDPRAVAGNLSFRLTVNDRGSARFLIGSDSLAERCMLVELVSDPVNLIFRVLQPTIDGAAQIGAAHSFARHNMSAHDVGIAFTESAIDLRVDGQEVTWPGIRVDPGYIGLKGQEQDGFRVYRADLALRA